MCAVHESRVRFAGIRWLCCGALRTHCSSRPFHKVQVSDAQLFTAASARPFHLWLSSSFVATHPQVIVCARAARRSMALCCWNINRQYSPASEGSIECEPPRCDGALLAACNLEGDHPEGCASFVAWLCHVQQSSFPCLQQLWVASHNNDLHHCV